MPAPEPRAPLLPGRPTKTVRALAWMLLGAFLFALMGALAHGLRERVDWRLTAFARAAIGLLLALATVRGQRARLIVAAPASLWVRSLGGAAGVLCFFYAVPRLPLGDAFTLGNTTPLWVAVLSWAIFRVRPARSVWAALALGLVGVALVEQPHLAIGNFAAVVAVAGSIAGAIALLGLERVRGLGAGAVVAHFSGVSSLATFATLALGAPTLPLGPLADPGVIVRLVAVGALGTLGKLAMTRAFMLDSAPRVSVIALSEVAFAAALDHVLWHRALGLVTGLGMVLVVVPAIWLVVAAGRPPSAGAAAVGIGAPRS